jgi:hypothetical protein
MVVKKPRGTRVQIVAADVAQADGGKSVRVRLTDDPVAPVVHALDPDHTHPFRQTEVLTELNKRLPGTKRKVTGYDVQSRA